MMREILIKTVIVCLSVAVLGLAPTTYVQAQQNTSLEARVRALEAKDKQIIAALVAIDKNTTLMSKQIYSHRH